MGHPCWLPLRGAPISDPTQNLPVASVWGAPVYRGGLTVYTTRVAGEYSLPGNPIFSRNRKLWRHTGVGDDKPNRGVKKPPPRDLITSLFGSIPSLNNEDQGPPG